MVADAQGVQGISDIITIPGLVNVDFADVKAIMCNSGTAMLGVGVSTGKNRAEEAAMARPRPPDRCLRLAPGSPPQSLRKAAYDLVSVELALPMSMPCGACH